MPRAPGAIRAFGDHKGSGLAFMCEILGGSLSGNGATDPKRGRFANGMLSFYVDPKVFDPAGFFPQDISKYVGFVKSSRPTAEGGEILVPARPSRACASSAWPTACRCPTTLGRDRRDRAERRPRRAADSAGGFALGCFRLKRNQPHPEEARRPSRRWERALRLLPILRDGASRLLRMRWFGFNRKAL